MPSAILFSEVEAVAGRFPDAVPEFRDFLSQHGLSTGDTEAIPALAQKIAEGGEFREQLASMLNVICLLENKVSYLELLGLLLVAAAGQDGADAVAGMPAFEEPVRGIFNFVVEVKKTRQDAEEAEAAKLDAEDLPEPSADNVPAFDPATSSPPVTSADAQPLSSPIRERGSVLARALAVSADEAEFGDRRPVETDPFDASRLGRTPSFESRQPPAETRAESAAPSPPVPPPDTVVTSPTQPFTPSVADRVPFSSTLFSATAERPERRSFPRWAGWVLGACGILLGFLLGLLWHRSSPTPVTETKQTSSAAADNAASAARRRARAAHHDAPAAVTTAPRTGQAWDDSFIAESMIPPVPHTGTRHTSSTSAGSNRSARPATATTTGDPGDTDASGAPNTSSRRGAAAPSSASPRAGAAVPRVGAVNLGAPADSAYSQASRNAHLPSVVTGASGIMAANLLSSPAPAYPAQATAQKVQGEVVIEAIVGRDGRVVDTRVVSGPELLRDAAVRAVQDWRFRPYEVDGAPAEIATQARLEFRLPRP